MKKNFFCLQIFFLLFLFASCSQKENIKRFSLMDTYMTVKTYGSSSQVACQKVYDEILKIEEEISVTKESSDVYKINSSGGKKVFVSDDTLNLLKFSLDMAEKSDGALNVCLYPIVNAWGFTTENYRVPLDDEINSLLLKTDYKKVRIEENTVLVDEGMMLDFGSVGKGFAGDKAIKVLKECGIKSALVDLGGSNIETLGKKIDGSLWTIGVKNPFADGIIGFLKIGEKAVITSGGYQRFFEGEDGKRYIHIFDGSKGRPVENEMLSSSVVCESGLYGDALSTALFVMGLNKAIDFWKKYNDFDFIFITSDKKVYVSEGLENSFTLSSLSGATGLEIIKK